VNELVRSAETPIEQEAADTVMSVLKKYSGNFRKVLPPHLSPDRCAMLVMNSIAVNPALAGCSPVSFLNAVLLASNLGLEIRKNSAYLIPYGRECQLIVDYHGKMELARRAGVGAIHCELVREGDTFEYGIDRDGLVFNWRPKMINRGEVKAVFVSARINGSNQVTVMTVEEIELVRRRAKSGAGVPFKHYGREVPGLTLEQIRSIDPATLEFKSPYRLPWVTDWDRMARKTAIHRAANDWPMSSQLLTSQDVDVAVETGAPMPLAEGMATVVAAIDPADNLPMVNGGGDSFDEQRETLRIVGEKELAKAKERK
jgi:phage RecT family recombinase